MAGRQIYNPDGFKNIEADGKVTGFEFQFKAQYYRGITPVSYTHLDVYKRQKKDDAKIDNMLLIFASSFFEMK